MIEHSPRRSNLLLINAWSSRGGGKRERVQCGELLARGHPWRGGAVKVGRQAAPQGTRPKTATARHTACRRACGTRVWRPARLTTEGDSLPSRGREGLGDGWDVELTGAWLSPYAGILKFSPLASTAQAMRAFLAAIATTARQ